jgi:exodeoxyribonuclease VII small subunit
VGILRRTFAIQSGGSRDWKKYCGRTSAKDCRVDGVDGLSYGPSKAGDRRITASIARNRRGGREFRFNLIQARLADGVNQPVAKKPEPQKKPDFERSLARLEEVVRRLESPQLSLDEAMKLFEEGVGLSRECQKQLEEAEGRVEILLKKADGKMAAETFEAEGENES